MKVLCKENNIEIIDWNSENIHLKNLNNEDFQQQQSQQSSTNYESQINLFRQFLFKSSRYSTDQIFNQCLQSNFNSDQQQKKILFIKELPYFVYREMSNFQSLLRNFKKFSKYSLVLNMTHSSSISELNPAKILTQDLRKELNITEINFNPVAATYMTKHIEKIAKLEGLTFLDKHNISEISQSSDGDLRHALNTLELAMVHQKLIKQVNNIFI